MHVAVTHFDAGDRAAVRAAYEINVAAARADTPDLPARSRHSFHTMVSDPYPGQHVEWALGLVDGEPAGFAMTELPLLDNTDNAAAEIYVDPAYRRRGVGRALHEDAVRIARRHQRKRLTTFTTSQLAGGPERDPAGDLFAAAMGATSALTEVRSRLDLTTVDQTVLDDLLRRSWPRADGYSLVRWTGAAPAEYVADVAYLDGRLLADSPMGDLAWEPERVDAARVRATEVIHDVRRRRMYHVGARHDATDRLVAWTTLSVADEPDWHAWQQITIVDPEHRGHRLGMIVKIENLRHMAATEPAPRYIDTCNAAENDHMISINQLLGFRPVDLWVNWQEDI